MAYPALFVFRHVARPLIFVAFKFLTRPQRVLQIEYANVAVLIRLSWQIRLKLASMADITLETQKQNPQPIAALSIRNLVKCFGPKRAVDDVSIELQPGAFYGLLGANGAGKTTTMRMVAGLLAQDAGSIHVYGRDTLSDPRGVKSMVAWLPDEPLLYDKLTPVEYLEFVSGLWAVERHIAEPRAEELLRWLDLWDVRDQRCEGFSRGMRQKTALAGALIHDPKLLLLDEPFSGLDAAVARQVKDLLVQKTKEGATIVLTTHVMEIAQRLAQTIAIISNGKILAEGDLEHLRHYADMPGSNLEDLFIALVDRQAASAAP